MGGGSKKIVKNVPLLIEWLQHLLIIAGTWSTWGTWTTCSLSCGGGVRPIQGIVSNLNLAMPASTVLGKQKKHSFVTISHVQ